MKEKAFRVIHQSEGLSLILDRMKGIDWGGWVWHCLPLLAYASGIFYFSSVSDPKQELAVFLHAVNPIIPAERQIFPSINNMFYHTAEYTVLAVLIYRAFRYFCSEKSEIAIVIMTVVAVVLFGCSDEIHQWFTPFRSVEGRDLMADALGGIIGVSIWQGALSIPMIRLLEERIPLKLQVALGFHILKM